MADDLSTRAMDAAIFQMEDAFRHVVDYADKITLPQYRRLKTLRHKFADFLIAAVRADEKVPVEPRE